MTTATVQVGENPSSNARTSHTPSRAAVGAASALGVFGVYCAFYLRSPEAVHAFLGTYGGAGVTLALFALFGLCGIAAAWAVFSDAANLKSAFSIGMGFPGLVFGLGIVSGSTAGGVDVDAGATRHNSRRPIATQPIAAQPPATRSLVRDAVGMVFAPVQTRVNIERVPVERALDHMVRRHSAPSDATLASDWIPQEVEVELLESIGRTNLQVLPQDLERLIERTRADPSPRVREASRTARERELRVTPR